MGRSQRWSRRAAGGEFPLIRNDAQPSFVAHNKASEPQPHLADGGYSLVLPSGRVLGHRALKVYYAQRLRNPHSQGDPQSKVQLVRASLSDPSLALIPSKGGYGAFGSGLDVMRARNAGEAKWARKQGSSYLEQRKQSDFRRKIGFVANNQKRECCISFCN